MQNFVLFSWKCKIHMCYKVKKVIVHATTGGQSALALRLLLAIFSSKISSGANRSFGDEVVGTCTYPILPQKHTIWNHYCTVLFHLQFRAARKVSEEIGAQIVLGDRPIEITVCSWSVISMDNCFELLWWTSLWILFCFSARKSLEFSQLEWKIEIGYITFSWYILIIIWTSWKWYEGCLYPSSLVYLLCSSIVSLIPLCF